jgi:hypothetical protein
MLRLFMRSLTMCCILFSLFSLTILSIFMSCYMLIRSSKTLVQFTNAETIYVKPYYVLYHILSLESHIIIIFMSCYMLIRSSET